MDGSRRSRHTIEITRLLFSPGTTRVTFLTVVPEGDHAALREAGQVLEELAQALPGYQVETLLRQGDPGPEIICEAREGSYDTVLMTRSSRGPLRRLGSVAAYVIKHASDQNVFVMHEGHPFGVRLYNEVYADAPLIDPEEFVMDMLENPDIDDESE